MHIVSIKIANLGGIEYFETPLNGGVSCIVGRNGSGKTSILDALRWMFNGGVSPRLLRDRADEGWCEFILSSGYRCHERLWRKEGGGFDYQLSIFTPDGAECPAPKTLLDSWMPKQSFDADLLVASTPKERAKFLLRHVPLDFTSEEINAALNPEQPKTNVIAMTPRAQAFLAAEKNKKVAAPASLLPPGKKISLEEFEEILALRLSQRTESNRLKDQLDGTVTTLQKGLGNADERDWSAERSKLEANLRRVESEIAALQARLRMESGERVSIERTESGKRTTALRDATAAYAGRVRGFTAHVEQFVAGDGETPGTMASNARWLAESVDDFILAVARISQEKAALIAFVTKENAALNEQLSTQTAELESNRQSLSIDLGIAKSRAEAQQQLQGVRNTIVEQQEYVKALEYSEADLTRSIRALEQLKTLKLRAVAIPGFGITYIKNEPRISIEGRDFDAMNLQEQIFTSFRFLRLANPELPFILCESSNAIDSENMEALTEAAERSGIQFILEKCLANQPLKMMPAAQFVEAEKKADALLTKELETA